MGNRKMLQPFSGYSGGMGAAMNESGASFQAASSVMARLSDRPLIAG
jgi:hypothetical protein